MSVSVSTPLLRLHNLTSPLEEDFKKVMRLVPVMGPALPEDSPFSGALEDKSQALRCPLDPEQDWEAAMQAPDHRPRTVPQGVACGITRSIMQKTFGLELGHSMR